MIRYLLLGAAAAFMLAPATRAERGADGDVKIIYWQAPSILNPYLSGGTKDIESLAIVIEPLGRYTETGALVPYLARKFPPLQTAESALTLQRSPRG